MTSCRGSRALIRAAGVLAILAAALAPSFTESAVANGETRTLYLYHAHTHEQIAATYLVNGRYDESVLEQLNWFLRDWRRDEPTKMDPRLFDVVWQAYRDAGANEPVHVVSAYRSPETNAMLRSRSRAVARHSQHMLGKAMDTTMPGMSMSTIREIGMRMQRGGVGYYPNAGTPFVHLDVGSVRSWPRMSYDQLVRLFPDGKTVHLPTNNQPLARYEEAKAEIEARGGTYAPVERKTKSFFAFLFGGEDDEDASVSAPAPAPRKQWASLAPRQTARSAEAEEEGAEAAPAGTPARRGRAERAIAAAERDLPRGETQLRQGPAEPPALERIKPSAETVASLEPLAAAEETPALAPLPPRRPSGLALLGAPLPPARPYGLVALSDGFASVPLRPGAGVAIANLIEASPPPAPPEARPAKPEPLLAYAPTVAPDADAPPPAAVAAPRRDGVAAASADLRLSSAVAKSPAEPAVAAKIALVPARLDRSNFQALTSARSARLLASGSALGSMIGAPRSAARAETGLFVASTCGQAGVFAAKTDMLPTDHFARR
ncbi:DUF882 domain-containing protein [Methylosinus trichosporium OB3b]|uniref:Murein endopeptidase K n=1 Tax=Methylosinus trichosporium (strain ATCC 35070 / NCIMB 11131 / UNIQEM 75 / OB3b) TaxID=595536 RepID=A0A2D2D5S5_METT3|nr:DUF882 domain-containing protein [Methylosinus trichosporium OB3b]